MKKFIIYKNARGGISAYEVENNDESGSIQRVINAGREILREYPVVASDKEDAIKRYEKANTLRGEAKEISSPEALQATQESIDAETFRGKIPAVTKQVATAPLKAVLASPKLAYDIYKKYIINDQTVTPTKTFVEDVTTPYQNPLAEEVLGDPTLIPSMFVPGLGEVRATRMIPKVAEYIGRRGAEGAMQNVASDIAMGKVEDVGDIASSATMGTLGGAGGSAVADIVGKGVKAGGKKILQSRWKGEGADIEKAMSAKSPSGKSTIKPFRSDEEILNTVQNDLDKYQALQGKSIEDINVNDVEDALSNLATKYDIELQLKKITPEDYDKNIGILQSEYGRFVGRKVEPENLPWTPRSMEEGSPIPSLISLSSYPASEVHNAKVHTGKLSRYDIQNQAETSSKLVRDAYKYINKEYNRIITEAEQANVDIPENIKQQYNTTINAAMDALNSGDVPTYSKLAVQATDLLEGAITAQPSAYKQYTSAMDPLMTAQEMIEPTITRTDKSMPLSLSMLLTGAGTYAGSQSIPGALTASTLPVLMQGTRAGTGAYRLGESLSGNSRYMLPLGIRALPETED